MFCDTAISMNHFSKKMSDLVAMRESTWRADIACHQNLTVLDDDATAAATVTSGTFSNGVGQVHKIFIPRWTFILLIFNILQYFFYPLVKLLYTTVVLEHIIRLMDALAEVLFVRVGVVHLTLLVGDESLVTH